MDYTNGATDFNRDVFVRLLMSRLGEQVHGPAGGFFGYNELLELMQDAKFYALSNDQDGDDLAVLFVRDIVKARVYKKTVKDCENLANKAIEDMSDASSELGWGANCAAAWVAYNSKTLGDKDKFWGGYHVALAVAKWNGAVGDFEVWIVQLKGKLEDGTEYPELWSKPEDEVEKWVVFSAR